MASSPARWSLFVSDESTPDEVLRQLRHHAASHSTEGCYLRTEWRDRDAREQARKWLGKMTPPVAHYEGDVGPVKRYFADEAGASVAVSADRACYLDIEADSRVPFTRKEQARVLSWTVTSYSGERVARAALERDDDEAERAMLLALFQALDPYDVVLAWNGERYDEPVLRARVELAGIGVQWKRWSWLDMLQVFEKYSVALTGEQKQSMALQAVAQAIAGEGKLGDNLGSKTWQLWCEDPARLLEYNEHDTRLMQKIEARTHYVRLHLAVCRLCRLLPTTRSLHANEIVDGYLLRLGVERGHRWPTRPDGAETDPFEGALVSDPKPGVYENVQAVDFASLYPSVIQTWNMSPETYLDTPELRQAAGRAVAVTPTTQAHFRTDVVGLFPAALDDLVAKRKAMQREQAALPAGTPEWEDLDGQSKAFKIVINSFYGVMGSPWSRYYVREIGRAVSQTARWLTETLLEFARSRWVEVIYADTDSAYMLCTEEQAERLTEDFNSTHVPSLLPRYGCARNTVKLAYEKTLRRIVIVSAKRYAAAVASYKGTTAKRGALEIKGLEYKRGDQIQLARAMQKEFIELLLREGPMPSQDELVGLAARWHRRVASEPLAVDDVVISQSIQREEYAAKIPPAHARVAEIMRARGEDVQVGTRIHYWVAGSEPKLDPKPASDYDEKLVDRDYYWDKRIWPPSQRLLEAAVPSEVWDTFRHLTHREPRRRRSAGQGQGDLFAARQPAASPAVAAADLYPVRVRVSGTEDRPWQELWAAAKAVLDAHAGRRQVTLLIAGDGESTTVELAGGVDEDGVGQLRRVFGRDWVDA